MIIQIIMIIVTIITLIITLIITIIIIRWRTQPQRWQTWTTTAALPGFSRPPLSGILIFLFAFKFCGEYFGVFYGYGPFSSNALGLFLAFVLFISIHTFARLPASLLLRILYFFAFMIALIVFEYVLSALMEYLHHMHLGNFPPLCCTISIHTFAPNFKIFTSNCI